MKRPEPRRIRREAESVEWRRRYAALACPPGEDGVRDPLDRLRQPDHPSTFSLGPAELAAEAARCRSWGFQDWELAERLDLTAVAAA